MQDKGPVVTLGETMALMYSDRPGPLQHAHELKLGIGGAESNVAVGLCRLGTPAAWIGRVGHDSLGERVTRELRAEGIDVHAVVDGVAPTGVMIKEQRTTENAHVWYYRVGSAGSRLATTDLPRNAMASAALLHVTGITPALSDSAHAAVMTAIEQAAARVVPVSFDVNHRTSLWRGRDATPVYREMARHATVLFAGEDEARLIAPDERSVPELAEAIAATGPSQVVIKLGARGCYALIDGTAYERDAVPVQPVDTVGAGDAFVAGYLAEFVSGHDVATRLTTAVTAGAFACLAHGDWEGLPRRAELALLGRSEPVTR
ncbi:sugar kinase [Streptomyces cucumeris]|uniref:sugar kinase n=1 Tax=Streptomyces cucumeris TaxID=2962890 RepID=UPI0020C84888|nr:sugar kinase [Streptomyces sp. NEAU-Y11]MCP9213446.1 sugar kinase [Streptomyces sp. NEAU-Y11]